MKNQHLISQCFPGILLFLLVFCSLFKITDSLGLLGGLISMILFFRQKKFPIRANVYDCCIFCIWIYTGLGIVFSLEPIASFAFFKSMTYSLYAYMIVRMYHNSAVPIQNISFAISLLIGAIGTIAFVSFDILKDTAYAVGFSDLYHLRHLHHPIGYPSNIWSSLSVLFLGFLICTTYWNRHRAIRIFILYIIAVITLLNVIISFSRGTYISVLALLLLLIILLFSRKNKIAHKMLVLAAIIIPLCIITSAYSKEVRTTLHMTETVSQQRSINGRLNQIHFARNLAKEHYWIGSGSGTYNLIVNNSIYENDNVGFSNIAPNGYTQLYVEQGVVGAYLWLISFILIVIGSLQSCLSRQGVDKQLIIIAIFAVFSREATTSTLLNNTCFGTLLLIMTGILINSINLSRNKYHTDNLMTVLTSLLLIISICIIICNFLYLKDISHNDHALTLADNSQYDEAYNEIEKTSRHTPFLINRAVIAYLNFSETGECSQLSVALDALDEAGNKNPYDPMIIYYKAIIFAAEGKTAIATELIRDLADTYPNKSLYNLTSFDMLYRNRENKDSIVVYLGRIVDSYPPFLGSKYWEMSSREDTTLHSYVTKHISEKTSIMISPIEEAVHGAALTYINQHEDAIPVLENSVQMMPHLIYPWYYLYSIYCGTHSPEYAMQYLVKFLFLQNRIRSTEDLDNIHNLEIGEIKIGERPIVCDNYELKFHSWYLCQTRLVNYFNSLQHVY